MKVIKTREKGFSQKIQNELSFLMDISHQNIVRYFEHFEGVFNRFDCFFIITEYCHVSSFIF